MTCSAKNPGLLIRIVDAERRTASFKMVSCAEVNPCGRSDSFPSFLLGGDILLLKEFRPKKSCKPTDFSGTVSLLSLVCCVRLCSGQFIHGMRIEPGIATDSSLTLVLELFFLSVRSSMQQKFTFPASCAFATFESVVPMTVDFLELHPQLHPLFMNIHLFYTRTVFVPGDRGSALRRVSNGQLCP
jgi:hypothetical protein